MNIKHHWQRGLVYLLVIMVIVSCRLPFDLFGRGEDALPTETVEEIAVVVSTEEEFIPTETMTPTITETPDPISLLPDFVQEALGWMVFFEEDFVNPDDLWFTGEVSYEELFQAREITNGQYVWNYENIDSSSPLLGLTPVRSSFNNFYAAAAFQLVEGTADTSYGLTFRNSGQGGYLFSIRDNSWCLAKDDRDDILPIIDWQPSDAIIPGGMNELAVAAHGEQIALLINGELVAEITDDSYSQGQMILFFDLVPGEKATLAMDNFLLRTDFAEIVNSAQGWGQHQENLFAVLEEDWPSGSVDYDWFRGNILIADGRYIISGTSNDNFIHRLKPDGLEPIENAYLTLDITPNYVEDETYAGLVIHYSDQGYYLYRAHHILIADSDIELLRFDVLLYYGNEWETLLPRVFSKTYEGGQTSQLGVITYEDQLVFLVDGIVHAAIGDSRLSSGKAGIAVGAHDPNLVFDWEFSNFNLYLPDVPVSAEADQDPTPTVEAAPVGDRAENPIDGARMVFVPAGEFLMGYAGADADEDEGPERQVYLDSYWLYETPVTNRQYHQCIEAGGCSGTLSRFPLDNYPVTRVDWQQAGAYCEWVGGRLPTEAEWEKGARGTDGRLFPWGTGTPNCNLANYQGCYSNQPTEVGRFPDGASPYGALDMLGLVWEWVSDWYDDDYYTYGPSENPTGPVTGRFRVQRGHSFESNLIYLRLTDRAFSDPFRGDYRKGFRCVLPDHP